ncbi:MAG: tol-pal system protein YbgF [Desulfovibrionaceae bacterium]
MAYAKLCMMCVVTALLAACAGAGGSAPRPTADQAMLAAADRNAAGEEAARSLESLEWRLRQLEASFMAFQEEQRSQRAELMKRLDSQDARLDGTDTSLEASRRLIEDMRASLMVLKSSAQARQNAVTPEAAPQTTAPAPQTTAAAPQTQAAPRQVMAASAPQAAAPAPPAVEPKLVFSSGAKAVYDKAYAQMQAGRIEDARKGFNDFLAAYPKDGLAPNALYWLGETYYNDKRFAQSILTFKEVTRRFPKHTKAAAAMLKIGFAYDKLGDASNAAFYLRTLLEDYPGSDPAALAQAKLNEMR